jgi:hypothetical protein
VAEIEAWAVAHRSAGVTIYLPEIADYELRREMLRLRNAATLGCWTTCKAA